MDTLTRRSRNGRVRRFLPPDGASFAQSFASEGLFSTVGRSIWADGPAFVLDTGQQFLGANWNLGKTIGGIDTTCVFGVCASFGARIGAQTTGRVGLDYSLTVNSGAFDLLYPGQTIITVPTSTSGTPGNPGPVTLGTAFQGLPAIQTSTTAIPSTLQVTGPTLQAGLAFDAHVSAFAGAEVCVVLCTGPAFAPPPLDKSQPILSINQGNNGKLSFLGQEVSANQNVSALGGLINGNLRLPNLDSSSAATPGGFANGLLTSTKQDGILGLNANLAQIAANAVGFPLPLSGNLGPFGYNLVQSNAGLALDLRQTLTFAPLASGSLMFSSPVTPLVDGVQLASTNRIDFTPGQDVAFLPGQVSGLGIQPFIDLRGALTNTTDLVVHGDINVQALGLNIAGATLGPLVNQGLSNAELGSVNLYANSFEQDIGSFISAPININFNCGSVTGGGEFRTTHICASTQYVDAGPVLTLPDGSSIDRIDTYGCSAYATGYNATSPSCYQTFSNYGSFYFNGPDGKVFFTGDPLDFAFNAPGASSTDEDALALLRSLGYQPGLPAFSIPDGASLSSFAVPEPGTVAMLGLGFGALFLVAGRRRLARRA